MKIDWQRIKRTAIQAISGAGVAFLTTLTEGFTKESLVQAIITFVATVGIAVLMNIKSQTEDKNSLSK